MSDFGEGMGTAIEGGLLGRAAEREATSALGKGSDTGPSECSNCGTPGTSPFCPQCGQRRSIHRTLSAIFHDIVHGVLHLDGKFWATLPLLVFRPGQLTRRYIEGERAKFVSPMAMFLFSVFAMFAIFQAIGFSPPTQIGTQESLVAGLDAAQREAIAERDEMAARVAELDPDDPSRHGLEIALKELQENADRIGEAGKLVIGGEGTGSVEFTATGIDSIDRGIIAKWRENPGLMLYKLQANSYKFSWLLIPLSIPFVWLLFAWKRRFRAYDHAIFVTYSLAFMSLLFITASLASVAGAPGWVPFVAVTLIAPIHIYKQLRGAYELSRFSAFWRFAVLLVFINIVLLLFLQALLLLGAF
ncbi:DUF3667 domain-containing protein [Qipengyuania nanhaisediminis]|uniref:DUF3667 domain-containing protein n=1 Tax=Qipengyuania nanhaisediminis TaxID=604088 RepID=UPI0038B2D458